VEPDAMPRYRRMHQVFSLASPNNDSDQAATHGCRSVADAPPPEFPGKNKGYG